MRRLRCHALAVPQLSEENPHLAEGLPGGARNGNQCRVHGIRVLLPGVPRAIGLGDHHRERVRDDVVHVAGDSVALLLDDDILLGVDPLTFGDDPRQTALTRLAPGLGEQAESPAEHEHREDEKENHEERDGPMGVLADVKAGAAECRTAPRGIPEIAQRQVDRDDNRTQAARGEPEPFHLWHSVRGCGVQHGQDGQIADIRTQSARKLDDSADPRDDQGQSRTHPTEAERRGHEEHNEENRHFVHADGQARQQAHGGSDDVERELARRQDAEHGFYARCSPITAARKSPLREPRSSSRCTLPGRVAQKPRRPSCFGSRCHSLATLTRSERKTCLPTNDSICTLALAPTSVSLEPWCPMMMPF